MWLCIPSISYLFTLSGEGKVITGEREEKTWNQKKGKITFLSFKKPSWNILSWNWSILLSEKWRGKFSKQFCRCLPTSSFAALSATGIAILYLFISLLIQENILQNMELSFSHLILSVLLLHLFWGSGGGGGIFHY